MASHLKPPSSSVGDTLIDAVVGRFQWPEGAVLYYLPTERELLPDKTRRLVFQAYLEYANLAYSSCTAINADYMSPSGESPFLVVKFGTKQILFSNIFKLISFLEAQKLGLGQDLDKKEKAQHEAYLSLIKTSILPAIDYNTWISKSSRKETLHNYSNGLPWPLKYIVPYSHYIRYSWNHWNMYRRKESCVHDKFHEACHSLSILLGHNRSFYQSGPTTLDSFVCGFVEAILSYDSPLKDILNQYGNLVEFCRFSELSHRKGLQFISSPSNLRLASGSL